MKVLITGAAGQLGRALVVAAPNATDVVALTRAELDLADTRSIEVAVAAHAPALIINAAAYTSVDKAESEKTTAYAINCDAAGALALSASRLNARLVHISTDFVFDGATSSPYQPDHPVAPVGVYGASKAAGELVVLATLPDALIVRTAWVYAAQGANFMLTMLRLMAERPALRVVADQVGTPTHAASLARAIWRLAAADVRGVHHFTDAGVASWYDFAVAIQEEALAIGLLEKAVPILPIRMEDHPTAAKRPSYSVLDKTRTYAALGTPARHWRAELREALRQLKTSRGH